MKITLSNIHQQHAREIFGTYQTTWTPFCSGPEMENLISEDPCLRDLVQQSIRAEDLPKGKRICVNAARGTKITDEMKNNPARKPKRPCRGGGPGEKIIADAQKEWFN